MRNQKIDCVIQMWVGVGSNMSGSEHYTAVSPHRVNICYIYLCINTTW